jgi:hypothetical protein
MAGTRHLGYETILEKGGTPFLHTGGAAEAADEDDALF